MKDLLALKKITRQEIDLKQDSVFNENNLKKEMDIGSCDRLSLLENMLKGSYTESESTFGNFDNNDYEFLPNIEITYSLQTDKEKFSILHKGAFINKTKTRAIIIQQNSSITSNDVKALI